MSNISGGSAHVPQDSNDEPGTFKIQILPKGSAPKEDTHKPDVGGELKPGLADLSEQDKEYEKVDVQKGLGKSKGDSAEGGHQVEIKSATEKEPESAESI